MEIKVTASPSCIYFIPHPEYDQWSSQLVIPEYVTEKSSSGQLLACAKAIIGKTFRGSEQPISGRQINIAEPSTRIS